MTKSPTANPAASLVPPSKTGRGKKLIMIAGAVLVIAALAGAGFVYAGVLHRSTKPVHKVASQMDIFVSVPQIVANLNSSGGSISYIKLKISLAFPAHTSIKPIKARMPEVVDVVQTYLRAQTRETLRGKAGTAALRAGIEKRLDVLFVPIKLHKVLFEEFIVQ
jgi:flagellar basal body-associated protein FliL